VQLQHEKEVWQLELVEEAVEMTPHCSLLLSSMESSAREGLPIFCAGNSIAY
jgi:hypothetical protein